MSLDGTGPAYEKGKLDVVVKRADLKRANSAVDSGMPYYKMDAKPRGLALIIEIEEYVDDLHEKRIGSQVRIKIKSVEQV